MIAKLLDTLSVVQTLNTFDFSQLCRGVYTKVRQFSFRKEGMGKLIFAILFLILGLSAEAFGNGDASETIRQYCVTTFSSNFSEATACTKSGLSCMRFRGDGAVNDCVNQAVNETMASRPATAQPQTAPNVPAQQSNSASPTAAPSGASPPTSANNSVTAPVSSNASSSGAETDPLIAQCTQTTNSAKNFCKDPLKYSSDGEINVGSRDNAVMATNLMMVAGTIGSSNKGICEFMKTGGMGITGLNATFAARCNSFINDCETACEDARKSVGPKDTALANYVDTQLRVCKTQRDRAGEMTGSAMQSLYAAQAGKLCMESLEKPKITGAGPPPEYAPGGTNCVTDPSNPLCAGNGTNLAGGSPNYGGGAGGNGGSGNAVDGGSGSGGGAGANGYNVDGVDGVAAQRGPGGSGSGSESKNAGVPNGGGGMVGGGGSGGGGGGDERPGRGGGGSGVNANVLQGERGGGGYSVSPGGGFASSGGGWSGYGNGSDSSNHGNGFDLSKFLPGQANAPTRGPAGLNRAGAEVAPMHEDIFQKISDRLRVVCKTNRLRDCN